MRKETKIQLRKLLELQRNQAAKRSKLYVQTEVDEIGAIRDLAYACFGNRGFVETNAAEIGIFYIGFYVDGPAPQQFDHSRSKNCYRVFRGATHAELEEQARLIGLKPWFRKEKPL